MKPKDNASEDLMLVVSVADQGIGMSNDEASKVFDGCHATRNLESKNLNPYGNGIGLSFCKKICQSLEGDISVQSVLGVGSEFTFTMKVMKVYGQSQIEEEKNSVSHSNELQDDRQPPFGVRVHYSEDLLDDDLEMLKRKYEKRVIQFQGVNFDLSLSRTTPIEV